MAFRAELSHKINISPPKSPRVGDRETVEIGEPASDVCRVFAFGFVFMFLLVKVALEAFVPGTANSMIRQKKSQRMTLKEGTGGIQGDASCASRANRFRKLSRFEH